MYLRWEHGNHLVEWKDGGFVVQYPQGPMVFDTWTTLANHLRVSLPYRSYFRLGVQEKDTTPSFILDYQEDLLKEVETRLDLLLAEPLGIDLKAKQIDIRKLVLAGFGRKIYVGRHDPEDVIQEVFKGLLIRNSGTCPWDRKKSSFGHYVHMVASCILSNYHRKQKRSPDPVDPGEVDTDKGQWGKCEIEDSEDLLSTPTSHDLCSFVVSRSSGDSDLVRKVFPHLVEGCTVNEISVRVGISPGKVSKVMKTIRSHSAQWAKQNALTHMLPKTYNGV